MSSTENQTTVNWDEMALVRPINPPTGVNWDEMALVRPINPPTGVNWDEMALVRPINPPTGVNWDEMALVRPINPPTGVNWDEMALVRPISAPDSIDISFGTELPPPGGFATGLLAAGALDFSGGYATFLLSSPDGNWQAIFFELGERAAQATSTSAEGLIDGGSPIDADAAIMPVGFDSTDLVLL